MSKIKKIIIIILLFLVFATTLFIVAASQKISKDKIEIEGCQYYTDEEMKDFIFTTKWDRNPFVLYFKTKYKKQKTIPFVDEYSVKITSLHSAKVTVYEKKIIGYVVYKGLNMYFDKDGTVVESSSEVIENVPKVTGLDFDSIILSEKLPVKDDEVFHMILDTTQSLQKYKINVSKLYISEEKEITLFINDIVVDLGKNDNLNDKIRSLNDMLPSLDGLKGTLNLKVYNENNTGYTFKKSQ